MATLNRIAAVLGIVLFSAIFVAGLGAMIQAKTESDARACATSKAPEKLRVWGIYC